jgi:A/G-specific adenine glycosylase
MEELCPLLPELLLDWYQHNHRDLPWRRDQEPYHVWLSEIMLQQTRVEAVKGYYARFLEALPTVADLAAADPDALHKLWEGLGYYSRVRNLQKAAQVIMTEHGGVFPRDYASIRALPGIGDYTAGAICSICFEQPTPAVDGNVLRVMARICEITAPVTDLKIRREVAAQLAAVYPKGACGTFTQALMELGATVCVPNGQPQCAVCPCAAICQARAHNTWASLPVKAAKKPRRQEDKTVFLLCCGEEYAVVRRPKTGLLAGLWAFPNVEGLLDVQAALDQAAAWGVHPTDVEKQVEKQHIFTHVQWNMRGYYLQCSTKIPTFTWVTRSQLEADIALPTAFRQFWETE